MNRKGIFDQIKDQAQLNYKWAQSLIDGMVASGLQHVVISPGSRSTPLTLACSRHPDLKTWVQIDERCAAFFALGLARETEVPVALVCTSGSAPSHWLPAVIEANHNLVPLILLTANRPPELWGWGENQTIDQSQLFSGQTRSFFQLPLPEDNEHLTQYSKQLGQRAFTESRWPLSGPVHLDIPFREPLVPDEFNSALNNRWTYNEPSALPILTPNEARIEKLAKQISAGKGIIVAGPETTKINYADEFVSLANKLGVPILADPLSGLRFGQHNLKHIVTTYDTFLRNTDFVSAHQPDWIFRLGAMPVSKSLQQYMATCTNAHHILVDPCSRWQDPQHQTTERIIGNNHIVCEQLLKHDLSPAPAEWFNDFMQQEQQARDKMKAVCDESILIKELIAEIPDESIIFSGNSMPIRNFDSFSESSNKILRIIANRGASGIDGNVSTLAGLAAARSKTKGIVVGLIGDLTCYHDMNGLLATRDQDVLIIVVNNGGGGIFHHLPQSKLAEFEQFWQTPHGLDFEKVASLYDIAFYRVDGISDFSTTLKQAMNKTGARMLEVLIDPEQSRRKYQTYWKQFTS